MKKIFKLTTIIISILALNSCGTIREGFSSQKKNSIDEFLVEKKSPLVMPPDFNELPLPQQTNQATENEENTDIKSLLTDNKDSDLDNQNTIKTQILKIPFQKKLKIINDNIRNFF